MAITIDETLRLISFAGTELVNGNANHGPMAAEVLFALGRDEAVLPWVEGYRGRLIDRPTPALPIPGDDWREWVPHLAPALMSAATHGLIRAGHAARSLSQAATRDVSERVGPI